MRYTPKQIEHVGKHDFSRDIIDSWNTTFSIGVFRWELRRNGKSMKKSKAIVRVSGLVKFKEDVFQMADYVADQLDSGTWNGNKTVKVK